MRMNGNAKRLFFLLSSSYFIVGGQRVAKFFPFSFQVFVASHFYTTFILLVVSVAGEMKNTSSLFCSVLSWMWKVGNKVCSSVYTTRRYYGKMMNLLDIPASLYDTQIWMCFTTASYSTDVVKLVTAQCWKISQKVAFNIASEASYALHFEWTKVNGPFWRVFENLKIEKETFLGDFQPICNSSTCDSTQQWWRRKLWNSTKRRVVF